MNYEIDVQLLKSRSSDLSFYTRNGKQFVKRKSRVSSDRLKNGPEYRLFRQHQQDFKLAASSSKLLRNAFAPLLKGVTDSNCFSRLTAQVLKVVKSDTKNSSGQRNILDGDLNLLRGFEFNAKCPLSQVLGTAFQVSTDAEGSTLNLVLPALISPKKMPAHEDASHFRLVVGLAAIDFTSGTYQTILTHSEQMPIAGNFSRTIQAFCQLEELSPHPKFVVLGVAFSQQVKGGFEVLPDAAFNPLCLIEVVVS